MVEGMSAVVARSSQCYKKSVGAPENVYPVSSLNY